MSDEQWPPDPSTRRSDLPDGDVDEPPFEEDPAQTVDESEIPEDPS